MPGQWALVHLNTYRIRRMIKWFWKKTLIITLLLMWMK